MRKELTLTANRYFPDHDRYSDYPYVHHTISLEFDTTRGTFEIEYNREKDEGQVRHNTNTYLYFEMDNERLAYLANFLSNEKPSDEMASDSIDLSVKDGILRVRRKGLNESRKEHHLDLVRFIAKQDRMIIETFEGQNPMIPYYEEEHDDTPQDQENLKRLEEFAEVVAEELSGDSGLDLDPIPEDVKTNLRSAKWGNEVLEHITDGDKCLQNNQPHPALNSYIHAIEWTIISYLADSVGKDIIQDEKDGKLYYFAGRSPNLVDELTEHADIDQKTISKLKSLNSGERRWSAHHKSGEVTQDEIKAVRSRLHVLLNTLFQTVNK